MKTAVCISLVLALVAGLSGCSKQAAEPDASAATASSASKVSSLTVDGSAFVLEIPDGRVLRGAELMGATVHIAMNGAVVPVKIESVEPDPDQPDILRHDLRTPDGQGGWQSACAPGPYGEQWGFPVSLPNGHPGRTGEITLTCSAGAIAKCARFGYRPWAAGPEGEDLVPIHAACIHMVRADYCGNDQPATKDGTTIDLYDDFGIQVAESSNKNGFVFEAGWSPSGAVCVNHTRWQDVLTLEQLHQRCPRLASVPECNEVTARELGAKLFNASGMNR